MERVRSNSTFCNCIFRLLLTDSNFRDELSFEPYYFVGYENRLNPNNDDSNYWLSILYKPMKKLISEQMFNYSLQTMEHAFFTMVRPEFGVYYSNPKMITESVSAEITTVKNVLRSLFNSIESSSKSFTTESVKIYAQKLCIQESLISAVGKWTEIVPYINDESVTEEELIRIYNTTEQKNTTSLSMVNKANRDYTDFFDPRLLVRVDNRTYETGIEPLNFMLTGGFHSQTLTGFMTTTGGGKSTMLCTIMCDALRRGQNVYYANLEMNDYMINANIISGLTGRPRNEIVDNFQNPSYISELSGIISKMKLGRHAFLPSSAKADGPMNFKRLKARIEQDEKNLSALTGKDFHFNIIIIDYLYLMETVSTEKFQQQYQQRKQLVVEAHDFSQQNEYAVVTVFQANRQAVTKMTSGGDITADDLADSYTALSDMDNMFSVKRVFDEDTCESGIEVTDVKIREMYDGKKRYFFVPYDFSRHVYDSAAAKYIEHDSTNYTNPEYTGNRKKGSLMYLITAREVFDANPELKDIDIKTLTYTMGYMHKVSKCGKNYIEDYFNEKGWEIKSDPVEKVTNETRKKIRDAVDKTLAAKMGNSQPEKAKDVKIGSDDVKITGDGLFDI